MRKKIRYVLGLDIGIASVGWAVLLLDGEDYTFDFLMENLWWPGLTMTRPEMTKRLLSQVHYQKKGIMLDTGHLMHMNLELKTQDELTKSKFAIASQDYVNETGGTGINIDDLKENQQAGGTTVPPKEPEVVDNAIVEVPATYPGGEEALLAFVSKNLVYPAIAQDQELQGTVVLRFKVDVDGSVSAVKIEKSLSRECDEAAAAVVRKLRRFVPAKQQGHPVPVWFRLPIRFRIQ